MTPKKNIYYLFFLLFLATPILAQKFHPIPLQAIDLLAYIKKENQHQRKDTIDKFSLSEFITYSQYKEYLKEIKKDSSLEYYISQRPDSNIAPISDVYSEYINSTSFDNDPVLGICWDNAINYCIWKTSKDNYTKKIKFIYRLPSSKEWLAAHYFLEKNKKKHDLNDNYADWLLDSYYENQFDYWHDIDVTSDYYIPFQERDKSPSAWKRKVTIGNSYLYSEPSILFYRFWFFQNTGHKHIGFRLVKEYVTSDDKNLSINKFINQCIKKND